MFMILLIASFGIIMFLENESSYYREYAGLTCEGFNMELDFIKQIYPEFAEKKCEDIKIMIENQTKADVLCDQIKEINWPEKIDCNEALK